MNQQIKTSKLTPSRRAFIGATAAAAAGLTLGFRVPFAEAAEPNAEVNAWVVVNADDSVIIRIARSEMGQGSMTGLAQMVAEELGCDWSKVTAEFPTPGQNFARHRVWGGFFDRRQHGHPPQSAIRPRGWRNSAANVDHGRRTPLECCSV